MGGLPDLHSTVRRGAVRVAHLGLREGAPTNLMRTGAIAGLVAGALGAAVFAFHHPGGSVPFIALWYGGSILLCALVGAILGPRLLRW